MAYTNPLGNSTVITADEETRGAFLVRVYQHVGLALVAFIGFETLLFMSGIAESFANVIRRNGQAWLLVLGGFAIVNWMLTMASHRLDDARAQYLGLFGTALAQAVIFAPFLYFVFEADGAGTVATAAVVSLLGFVGLTIVGMVTRKDLSFVRPILMFGGLMALVLVIGAVLFGMNLGLWFSVAMVALAGASILYQTQNIIRTYPAWAHVAAAVSLFGSLMTMFWYVLRIFASRR